MLSSVYDIMLATSWAVLSPGKGLMFPLVKRELLVEFEEKIHEFKNQMWNSPI